MISKQIEVQYLSPSRSIEIYNSGEGCLFIYNYEGYHFRLFNDVLSLINFFQRGVESELSFDSEEELDDYLLAL